MRLSIRQTSLVAALLLSACGGSEDSTSTAANRETANAAAKQSASSASVASPSALSRMAIAGAKGQRVIDARLAHAKGAVNVWVSLDQPSLAAYKSAKLREQGLETQTRRLALAASGASLRSAATPAEQAMRAGVQSQRSTLLAQQANVLSQLTGLGAQRLGSVHVAHNAVAVKVDAASLAAIAQLPNVVKVRPVLNYKLALSDTVPYVGAAAAQAAGKDGTGVRVAVIDSGIDYTHYNLGGPGTAAAYAAAYGANPNDPKNTTLDGLFPTAKVVGGYDFVGDTWGIDANQQEFGTRTEDPDPIDFEGHGTHVADIIAGHSADGKHVGVAPGASLVAIKVCSSVSTACNGVALLKAMDYALDPNGDGNIGDAVDVINLSLGSAFGQEEDDLTLAVSDAVDLGVVVAVAAGNNANRPYIVSSPSIAPAAISVAQTAVPSDKAYPLTVNTPAKIARSYANTATVDWAPVTAGFAGSVAAVGRGCPAAGATAEDPYLASPAGKVALIDRGFCSISLKVDRAAKAGAKAVLIGLIAPGDAVSFSNGGGDTFVPTLVIQQSLSQALKANLPATVTLSPAGVPLLGSVASTSARGPTIDRSRIKPEIGAPGASVSAIAGSGNGQEAFGGTSGATPMVAGAAAILVQAYPHFSPEQIKALLMNSAETAIYTNRNLYPGVLAPITRIGAGELRVDRSLAVSSLVRNKASHSAALSFGFHDVPGTLLLERKLLVENFSTSDKYFSVQSSFRYANDAASKAVRLIVPSKVWVPARGKQEVTVALFVDGRRLPDWPYDFSNLGDGSVLDLPEYDGYLTFTAGSEKLSVPWQVLPRKASDMSLASNKLKAGQPVKLHNFGWGSGEFDVFSLTGTSPKADRSELPRPGDNFAFIDLRAVGVRLVDGEAPGDTLQFAVNTFKRRANPNYPAEFDIVIDVDRDGRPDFIVYNSEQGGQGASGTSLINVIDLAAGTSTAYYLNDTDLQSSNAIFTLPLAALGIPASQAFDFTVAAFDNYFSGNETDQIGPMTYTPAKPKFRATTDNAVVAANGNASFGTAAVAGGAAASPDQSGLLLLYRRDTGRQADIVRLSK